MVKGTLNHFNLSSPDCPEGFYTLYFPDEKAIEASPNKELATKLISLKSASSKTKIRELSRLNPWFKTFLDLTLNEVESHNFIHTLSILKDLQEETSE